DSPGELETIAAVRVSGEADADRTLLRARMNAVDGNGERQVRDRYLIADGVDRADVVLSYSPDRQADIEELAFPLLDAVRWP
ncbi:MAG: hypothetical protein AAF907_16215, partial [Planctomycetota bacterium]